MDYLKNKNIFIFIISIIIIAIFLFFLLKQKKEPQKPKHIKIETKQTDKSQKVVKLKTIKKLTKGPAYNYDSMLLLIEKERRIERLFYSQFNTFTKNKGNLITIQQMVEALEEEKLNFNSYLQKMKSYYRRRIPNRKKNALRYYFRVIEDSIDELEDMKEKFVLNSQLEKFIRLRRKPPCFNPRKNQTCRLRQSSVDYDLAQSNRS